MPISSELKKILAAKSANPYSAKKSIQEFPEALGDLLMELTAELDRHQSINASVNSSSTE